MLDPADDAKKRPEPSLVDRLAAAAHLDGTACGTLPSLWRVVVAGVISVGLALAVDSGIIRATNALFPATDGFPHFRVSDYATLTVFGVVLAVAAWPVVAALTSTARWLYLRLAVAVTLVLWLPDVALFAKGEQMRAVLALMVMHLAIALITYNLVVRLAPVQTRAGAEAGEAAAAGQSTSAVQRTTMAKPIWAAMMTAVSVEFAAGLVALIVVPYSRPTGWLPGASRTVYLAHGLFGAALAVAAVAFVLWSRRLGRPAEWAAAFGLIGILIAAAGGILVADHHLRLLGMALMFLGSMTAFFGYLVPLVEESGEEEPAD